MVLWDVAGVTPVERAARDLAQVYSRYDGSDPETYMRALTEKLDVLCEKLSIRKPVFDRPRCMKPGCGTLLERYNESQFCGAHEPLDLQVTSHLKAGNEGTAVRKRCRKCGVEHRCKGWICKWCQRQDATPYEESDQTLPVASEAS